MSDAADVVDWFDALREAAPVHFDDNRETWFVLRYDDVAALLGSRRLGAPEEENLTGVPAELHDRVARLEHRFTSRWPVFRDPPQHTVLRRSILRSLGPEQVQAAVDATRDLARRQQPDASDDTIDLRLAGLLAAGLEQLLGVDRNDADLIRLSADIMAYLSGPPTDPVIIGRAEAAVDALDQLSHRLLGHNGHRLAEPLNAALSSGQLSPPDVSAMLGQLVTGSLEPTLAVVGRAVELIRSVEDAPELYAQHPRAFVEECIRLTTPFHFAPRRVLEDLDVAGFSIPAGARLVLTLVAANRDPRRFPDPKRFRIDRAPGVALAFGRGRHACPGANLAKALIAAMLDTILADLELWGRLTPQWQFTAGMRRLRLQ